MNTQQTPQHPKESPRVQYSKVLIRFAIPFALIWWIGGVVLDARLLALSGAIATVGLFLGSILHRYKMDLTARFVWLFGLNAAVTLGSFVTPPEGHVSFIFTAIAMAPVVIFSAAKNPIGVVTMVLVPVVLWLLVWAGHSEYSGPFEVSKQVADRVLAPASALTVFGTVLFVISYFVKKTHENAKRLTQAQRDAEKTSQAKSNLLRSVSHEMLTPLHAISGFAEFLYTDAKAGREVSSAVLQEFSGKIIKSSNTLLGIIENMFDFANWDGENTKPPLSDVSVFGASDLVVQRFSDALSSKSLRLHLNVSTDLYVHAHAAWVTTIFKQLIDNAIKFSNPGGAIWVSAQRLENGMIEVVIKDSGPGFPDGASETAFIPFERLGHETGTKSGIGIGLPLAKKFAEAMDGEVNIDEDHKNGARILLRLPDADHVEKGLTAQDQIHSATNLKTADR